MLSPDDLIRLTETMYPHIDKLNAWITKDMISRIMARLERGDGLFLTATDEWQAKVYKEAGGHYDALQEQIRAFTGAAESELQAIFEEAGIEAWKNDNEVYERNGYPSSAELSDRMKEAMESMYRRTDGTMRNFTRTTAQASQERLIRLLDEAHLRVISGAQSYTEAVRDIVNDVCEEQTKVKYSTGHVDNIETAVLRAVRTGVAQATGDMTMQGMIERDYDLIRVSAHLGARYGDGGHNPGNHAWWQGGLYSRTGRTKDLLPFVETTGYGTGEGLCGWNCRHSFGPGDREHNPYASYDAEENKRAYDLSQEQRDKERRIRASKRKLLGLETAINEAKDDETKEALRAEYDSTAHLLQRRDKTYKEFCSDNQLKTFNERLQVAFWNRQQARQATFAAIQYKNRLTDNGESDITNITTANGITMSEWSNHAGGRSGGRVVSADAVKDALLNPLKISDIRIDEKGRESQRFIGERATVNVNPKTGVVTTVWRTSGKLVRKYKK